MTRTRGLGLCLLAVALGVLALVYFAAALHALAARNWLAAGLCSPVSVVYGWAFWRAFSSLKETDHDAPG
jgi:membrane protein implicated in regulation of membrane protease activity